jgi:hypothetical protein
VAARIRRHFHADEWPVATIAAEVGRHYSTVRRVLTRDVVPAEASSRYAARIDPYLPFILESPEKCPCIKTSRLFAMMRERGYESAKDHF